MSGIVYRKVRIFKILEAAYKSKKYFDQFIIECAKRVSADKGFIKAPIVIGEALGLVEQLVGDTFLEYRLKQLIKRSI